MSTSVHIPKPLLAAVDQRAKRLKISRNRLIVQVLERELAEPDWPEGFFDRLRGLPADASKELEDSLAVVRANRRSKPPVKL